MGLIDSHAHLTDPSLIEQVDDVLARAAEAGVDRVLSVGVTIEDARDVLAVAERFPDQVRAIIGIHPHEAGKVSRRDLDLLRELIQHPLVVALGEIGLDYHYNFAEPETQQAVFVEQLEVAVQFDLPVVIHSREAFRDTVRLLVNHDMVGRPVVFHCFGGSVDDYSLLAAHTWRASFTGVVTFKNAVATQEVARAVPSDELMVETDCPYLSPVPVRGRKPNEPAYLEHIARFLAELRDTEYETIVTQTSAATERFFRLH
jgi:TatD DNase family protein